MFTIHVKKEDVVNDYPEVVLKWIQSAKDLNDSFDETKLEFYYSYGFFLPKVENKQDMYEDIFEKCSKMNFDERFEFELSKVRINLAMKMGHFFISNRMKKGLIPKSINDIVREITKVKMIIESEYHDNHEVKNSIPEIDTNIISFEIIKETINDDYRELKELDIDFILDKISQKGIDSLSDEEKEFLDKKSKNI